MVRVANLIIISGMLCRETGYRPILEASKILAKDHTPMKFPTTFDFPHELLGWKHESLRIQDDYTTAFRPVTIAEVDELKVDLVYLLCHKLGKVH